MKIDTDSNKNIYQVQQQSTQSITHFGKQLTALNCFLI